MLPKQRNFVFATYTILEVVRDHPERAYPQAIAKILGVNKSSALRRFRSMEKAGLIKKTLRTSSNQYAITKQGKEFLSFKKVALKGVGTATLSSLFRFHHLLFRLPVIEGKLDASLLQGKGFKVRKRGFVNGWEAAFGKSSVFYAGSAFLVFPKPFYSSSLSKAVEQAIVEVEGVGGKLKRLFPALELHDRSELCRQQMALKGGFTKWIPEGFNFKGDRLIIDFSTGEAEVETYGKFSVESMMNVAGFLDEVGKGEFERLFKDLKEFMQKPSVPSERLEIG